MNRKKSEVFLGILLVSVGALFCLFYGSDHALAASAEDTALSPAVAGPINPAVSPQEVYPKEIQVQSIEISGPKNLYGAPSLPAVDIDSGFILGPGDGLKITVWGYPELSEQVVILPDGAFSYPLLGRIQATGLTAHRLAEVVRRDLERHIEAPAISVVVSEMRSRHFSVMGAVGNAGTYPLWSDRSTLLEAVAQAGGWTADALPAELKIFRITEDGQAITIQIDGERMLDDGTGYSEIRIRPGDVVYVPNQLSKRKVCVLGEVASPGLYPWTHGMTVIDALSGAGWLRASSVSKNVIVTRRANRAVPVDQAADRRSNNRRRARDDDRKISHFTVNVEPDTDDQDWNEDIAIEPGDIIYVPEKFISKVGDFMSYLTSKIDPAARSYLSVYDAANPADFVVDRQ